MLTAGCRSHSVGAGVGCFIVTGITLIAAGSKARAEQQPSLANISTRMLVGADEKALIAGFIVTGNEPKKVMLRAIGPTLAGGGIVGALADPTLELFQGETSLAFNDNWKAAGERAEIEASTIPPTWNRQS